MPSKTKELRPMVHSTNQTWDIPLADWLTVWAIILIGFCGGCSQVSSDRLDSSDPEIQSDRTEQESQTPRAPTAPAHVAGASKGSAVRVGTGTSDTLPDAVKVFPKAVRVDSLRLASNGNEVKAPEGVFIFLSSDPDIARISSWYESELASAGWTISERKVDFILFRREGREISLSVESIPEPKPDGHADANTLIVIDTN